MFPFLNKDIDFTKANNILRRSSRSINNNIKNNNIKNKTINHTPNFSTKTSVSLPKVSDRILFYQDGKYHDRHIIQVDLGNIKTNIEINKSVLKIFSLVQIEETFYSNPY